MLKSGLQMIGIFLFSQWAMNQFFAGNKTAAKSNPVAKGSIPSFSDRQDPRTITNYSAIPRFVMPLWPENSTLDFAIYVSPSLALPALSSLPSDTLVLDEKDFVMGNYNDQREISTTFVVPKTVQENGTLWAHFYMALAGNQIDPLAADYNPAKATHFFRPLNQYLPKKKLRKLKNLLDKTEEPVEDSAPQTTIESFYHPNFTIAVIPDTGVQDWQAIHPAVRNNFQLEPSGARDSSGENAWYYPVVFMNRFWQLRSHMTEINSTVERLPLNIQLINMKNWKHSMYAAMDDGMKRTQMQAATADQVPATGDGSEFEKFKEILLDTNSYLLGTTFFVSILHMIFEALAFKNDIAHWRKKKDVVGTSVRTILANVFMQTIIFLYLLDNSDGTSWMILAGQGFGILLEAWKITKTVDVRLREPGPESSFSLLPYVVVFEDKHKLTETEKKTQEYDQIAFKYLYIIAVPLLGAYAVYSLVYETHKSWYSFVVETLVGSVYAYGFLMMVPSLYINYRLQSVAHLPGKAMTYKFLNTFIDDLFAFTIRMPTLHRLATLRDDVIFFVWLYQSYKYKVDYKRVNEFGQGGGESDADDNDDGGDAAGKETEKKALGESQATKELKPATNTSSSTSTSAEVGDVGKAQKRK
jgi:Cleft lip and palate transmembrane protein 1 (CLPTM1)